MNYSNRLKETRLDNDKTQKDVATYLNISPFTYSHYETQDHIIPLKYLFNISIYFNVSIDYLLGLTDIYNYKNSNKKLELKLVGKRLKEIRKELGITQEKLALKLNIARTMITDYELGNFLISTHSLYTICTYYNISADYLLGLIDSPKYIKEMQFI